MDRKQKLIRWVVFGSVYLLYLFISGGGILIEHRNSLAEKGVVAEARLTSSARVYLKETPNNSTFMVPLLFYYERYTYPFKLRFYGSTRSGRVVVTDERRAARDGTTRELVIVTEVKYYLASPQGQLVDGAEIFSVDSWADIVIPHEGDWVVESKGYVRGSDGQKSDLTFPTMTIRQTLEGRIRVHNALNYWIGGMMR